MPLSLSNNQKEAIIKAWTNEISFIQGPPGTGKSHTIAAILLTAVFMKKRVLLVSHKEAALKVVKTMVDSILGDNSVIYVGSKNKEKTRDYLDELLEEAAKYKISNISSNDKFINLRNATNQGINSLFNLASEIDKTIGIIKEDLTTEYDYYKSHQLFKKNRDFFEKNFSPKILGNIHGG